MRLNQVTLAVAELDRAVDFYQTLGLELIVHAPPRYARLLCPDGESTLSVEVAPAHAGRSGAVLYFECDDLDARCAELRAEGVAFQSYPTDQPWLWREARLLDPDGNPLCLFRGAENRVNPPWRLRPATP